MSVNQPCCSAKALPIPTLANLQHAYSVAFKTKLGWMGFIFHEKTLLRSRIGFACQRTLLEALEAEKEWLLQRPPATVKPGHWIEMFQQAAAGKPIEFCDIEIDLSWTTDFQTRVLNACRSIPIGETRSYGQLASMAGSPKAARAVGSVMAKNRFPMIVPCHRVVASNGMGGFSAPKVNRLKSDFCKTKVIRLKIDHHLPLPLLARYSYLRRTHCVEQRIVNFA